MSVHSAVAREENGVRGRTAAPARPVVVPDRTIRRSKTISPIINLQTAHPKKQPVARQAAVSSSMLHDVKQASVKKHPARPRSKPVAPAEAMTTLIDRHNSRISQLARTASRAQLLASAAEPAQQKTKWHQRFFAGFANG